MHEKPYVKNKSMKMMKKNLKIYPFVECKIKVVYSGIVSRIIINKWRHTIVVIR